MKLAWTVRYNIEPSDVMDVLDLYDVDYDDNEAMHLANDILNLPDDECLPAALDELLDQTKLTDAWLDQDHIGGRYECNEAIEDMMRELETCDHAGAQIDTHTRLRMRLLLEELNALFAFYDLEPLRTLINIQKEQLAEQTSDGNAR